MSKIHFFFIFLFFSFALGEEKKLIFSDDFSGEKISDIWKLDSPTSWEIKDGILKTTKYGGSASINKELPEDIIIEAKVMPVEPNPELSGGFGGINVSNINFVIRKDGFWWPYRKPGDERYSGGFKKADIVLNRWYQFKIIRKTGGLFEWYVDGEKICELVEPAMKGGVALTAWRFKMAYDDVKIYKLETEKQEGNLNIIRNSSFEILQDNLPIYWSPLGSMILTYGGMENFLKLWSIDKNEKFHGKQSLRMEKGGVYSYYFSGERSTPYVFSVYMKSDKENLPVELAIWEWNTGKTYKAVVNVDKEWKRYVCKAETNQTGFLRVKIEMKGEGILWVDAVKLEKGVEPTEYTLSPFDLEEGEEKKEVKLEEFIIKKVEKGPVIDGELNDSAWDKSLKIKDFLIAGETREKIEPKEKTEAYLCYDENSLYIAFKCYDSQIDKIKATVKEDGGPVWNDDCVEIFLDTNLDRKTYYQIAINSLGKINVIDKENNKPFEGKINRGVSIKNDHWIVEIGIPFSSLNITNLTGQTWGFNLGRENHKINEYSCTSPTKYLNFHDVENYNLLVFPEKDIFKKFIVEKKEEKKLPKKGPFIVDGKPFFVFAPLEQFFFGYKWAYKEGWENEIEKKIKFWKGEGFRSIVVVSKIFPYEVAENGWTKLFEYANKYNLKIVAWLGFKPKEGLDNNFEKFIEKFKNEPSLIAWCVADEPEIQPDTKPEEIIELVKRTKEVDKKHPVFVNYTPIGPSIKYAGLPGDILSTDLYITAGTGRPIREIIELVKLKDKIAREKNMWVWMWLVGNNMYNHFREPSAEEQEAQTYGAIISGCTGLMYFYGEIFGYKNWMKLKQLNKEIEILTPVIFSEEVEGIESNNSDVIITGRKYSNKYYIFAVNISNKEISGKINLPKEIKNYKKAKLVFENREIEIKDGIIIDKFLPYERHVYEISNM